MFILSNRNDVQQLVYMGGDKSRWLGKERGQEKQQARRKACESLLPLLAASAPLCPLPSLTVVLSPVAEVDSRLLLLAWRYVMGRENEK